MDDSGHFQQSLAKWIVLVGLGVCGLCAITAIVATALAQGDKPVTADAAKQILTIFLPVVGTWVGTVLAYYFGRENFEAGARQSRLSSGQRLDTPAIDSAIPIEKVKRISANDDTEAKATKLKVIDEEMKKGPFYRMPIFTSALVPLYVVHRQPLDSFIADQFRAAAAATPADPNKSLDDLLKSPQGERVKNSFATVPRNATLADAKSAMESNKSCQDVFITETGRATEPVLAWLTNNEIQRAASA